MRYDQPSKRLLREFFFDFLRLFENELAQKLDAEHLAMLDKELLGEKPGAQRHEVDLLARARVRGETANFLIHVEVQTQHQKDFARRMLRSDGTAGAARRQSPNCSGVCGSSLAAESSGTDRV